jgi:hypothetical protein
MGAQGIRRPGWGTIARLTIGLGVTVAIFYFLGQNLVSNWNDLRDEELDVQPALLVFSGFFLLGDILVRSLVWRWLAAHFSDGRTIPLGQTIKMYIYSWTGRYTPGKVAYVIGRFYLGRRAGISAAALVGSMAYENILLLVAGSALVTLTLLPTLAIESESVLPYIALPVLALGGIIALQPLFLRPGLQFALRMLGRDDWRVDWMLPLRRLVQVGSVYAAGYTLSGIGFYLMILSLTPFSAGYIPLAIGTLTVAGIAGMVSVITPAGLGVREGVITAVLQFVMPVELAVLVSIVARVWATAVDAALVLGCLVYDYFSGERMFVAMLRGAQQPETAAALDT